MFETFGFGNLSMGYRGKLSLFACGKTTGVTC